LKPLFAEEVLLGEQVKAIEQHAQHTSVPLAMGERLYSRWENAGLQRSICLE
jgi:galactonate dehydratase